MKRLIFAAALVTLMVHLSFGQENYSTWTSHRTIVLNTKAGGANITGPVTNFPVLIRLSAADSIIFANTPAYGRDIRFAKPNGTHLPYQVDEWNAASKTAAVWVLMDTVKAQDSSIALLMYWGNPAAADSSNGPAVFNPSNGFAAVYHLAEDDNPGRGNAEYYNDATGMHNGLDSLNNTNVTGIIGKGHGFDAGDCIALGTWDPSETQITLSAWMYWTADPAQWQNIIVKRDSWQAASMRWQFNYSTELSNLALYDGTSQKGFGNALPSINTWHHVALVSVNGADGGTNLYIDGVASPTPATSTWGTLTTASLRIGNNPSNEYFRGYLDEIRIDTVIRSADWIKLCYMNQLLVNGQDSLTIPASLAHSAIIAKVPAAYSPASIGHSGVLDVFQMNGTRVVSMNFGPTATRTQMLNAARINLAQGSYIYRFRAVGAVAELVGKLVK